MIWAWLINSVSVYITAKVLSGVEIKNFWAAVWVAAGISVANFLLGPILHILALPITILTFGLFAFVVNAFLVVLVDKVVDGFKIKSFGWAIGFSIILTILSSVLMRIFN